MRRKGFLTLGPILIVVGGILAAILIWPKKAAGYQVKDLTPIPEVEIVPQVPGDKYPFAREIRNSAGHYDVDPDLVAAIIAWETRGRFNSDATNPSDPSYGLGQVTPYIAVRFGIIPSEDRYADLYDPQKNTNAVAAYLDFLINDMKYPVEDSIQMYNEGEPNFWSGHRVPDYLAGVMSYYRKYRGW